jgi:predicted RNA-binding protein YlxR (DUF448 family)
VDFLCADASLVVELDGGQHSDRLDYDERRTAWLEAQGLKVLRFWNHLVIEELGNVCDSILSAQGGEAPHPPDAGASGPSLSPTELGRGELGRTRKCIVTGDVLPEDRLIRFVRGPDDVVVPDLARSLPGRGLWVRANREDVELAVRKGAFPRAAKAQLKAPADLADQVEALLKRRLLQALGLARRAGELTWGFEKVGGAISSGKAAWMIEAADGSADGRRKLLSAAGRLEHPPRLIGVFSSAELGLALGLGNVIHLAFLAGRGSERWATDVERLSGFRPLLPESWREEP